MSNFSNDLMSLILRSPLHSLLSGSLMVLTYTGRKSGREISTPVNYTRLDGRLLTTSLRSRTWWRNLRGGERVRLLIQGCQHTAQGTVFEGDNEVRQGFLQYFQQEPGAARFFGLQPGAAGKPAEQDLQKLVSQRVIVFFELQDG